MNDELRDDMLEQDWPELTEWRELMPTEVSPEFIEQTCRRVFADQQRIAAEADRVDEIQLPAEILAAYAPPAPSADFSTRLLARLQQQPALPPLLSHYSTPEPSADFIERTLAALRTPGIQTASGRRLPAGRWALAAVLVLALFLWPRPQTPTEITATAYSASPWATALATGIRARERGAPELRAADPLLLLASGALSEAPEE